MMIFTNSIMTTLYNGETPALENQPCTVRFSDTEILIEYKQGGELVHYRGVNDGSNHFKLKGPWSKCEATLHMFPKGKCLEGSWVEEQRRGMWKIWLDE
jgi:hypothetical protein